MYRAFANAHLQQAGQVLKTVLHYSRKVQELRPRETLDRSLLAWEIITLQGQLTPPELSAWHLERCAGTYGPRRVEYTNGQLHYSRDGRPRIKLTPLTETIFAVEGFDAFRVRFDTDDSGRVFRITGLYRNGGRDESLRDA